MRIFLVVQYLRARKVEAASRLATIHAAGYGTAAILWLGAAILDAPQRFYVWGVAVGIDLVTPMLCVHYTHRLPPDSAHIPERHGLFTIILIGESVTAVMRGIESQEGWTITAASAAILGLCLSFAFWWWYFNHNAEAENRKVTSTRNGVLFFAWSYAHFPMCLGIAVAGLGVKHIISMMPGEQVQAESIRIMLAAAALAMLSVVGVVITANEDSWQHRRQMLPAAAIGMAPALAIPAATAVAPGLILAYLVALCTVGMRLTRRKAKVRQVVDQLEAVEA